ncbi:MAG: hypothetical protein Q4A43_04315 [Coriobacteriia bacterium]|nr:hypothetical protein [Coriobacteriia bacterium]
MEKQTPGIFELPKVNIQFGGKGLFNGFEVRVERPKHAVHPEAFPALNLCAVAESQAEGEKERLRLRAGCSGAKLRQSFF